MDPTVQYTRTSDGVSVAYAVAGKGQPLIRTGLPSITHVQRDWQMYSYVLQKLARHFTIVWYDSRGTGLSDRSNTDFSMDAMQRDLDAVVLASGFDRFGLITWTQWTPVALVYAANHPDRVSNLMVLDGSVDPTSLDDMPQRRASQAVLEIDWDLYVQMIAKVMLGANDAEWANAWVEHYKASITHDAMLQLSEYMHKDEWHIRAETLGKIKAPTLLIHNQGQQTVPLSESQAIAASIPGARLMVVDDPIYLNVADLIADFALPQSERGLTRESPSSLRTVLFTDLVGHTEMMSRLGDEKGRAVLREHERITREVLKANGGTEVKTMGDGFMASFGSVTKAVECAIALQRAFADRQGEALNVRVGLNAGEPIEEDGDLFGATVILASRIVAKAEGGEILVADTVRGLCSGKGFLFSDRGEFVAKGFDEAVRVYEVRWRG